MTRQRFFTAAAVLISTSLFLVGCGSKASSSSTSTSSTSTTASSTTTSSTATTVISPVSVPPTSSTSFLTNVTAAADQTGDSVTFQFQNSIPGYAVTYSDSSLIDASGSKVTVAGAALVKVTLSLASGVNLNDGYKNTYTGPNRFTPTGTTHVQEVVKASDFESQMTWGIGTKSKVPFTVTATQSPPSIVIHFANS